MTNGFSHIRGRGTATRATTLIYMAVNLLFVMKYALRISVAACMLTAVTYVVLSGLLLWFARSEKLRKAPVGDRFLIGVFCVFTLLSWALQQHIDPFALRVDRWSAIHNFLSMMLDGEYPYMARTHLGGYGSPFPVWQLLHLPFYGLGNVGLSVFFGTAFLVFAVRHYAGNHAALRTTLLLFLSPAFIYETAVRSDLVTNFMVVAGVVVLLHGKETRLPAHLTPFALLCGLLMSTRLTAVIPLGLYFFPAWTELNWKQRAGFVLAVAGVFALTFLPFALWDMDNLLFFENNPFILQTGQFHVADFIVIAPLFVYLALTWEKGENADARLALLTRYTAVFLVAIVAITFAHNMLISGNHALFSPSYDITYFDMALPFAVSGLSIEAR